MFSKDSTPRYIYSKIEKSGSLELVCHDDVGSVYCQYEGDITYNGAIWMASVKGDGTVEHQIINGPPVYLAYGGNSVIGPDGTIHVTYMDNSINPNLGPINNQHIMVLAIIPDE